MDKQIIVEVDEDGFVVGVYCPDDTYQVDILDRCYTGQLDDVMKRYYKALEDEKENLKNCL